MGWIVYSLVVLAVSVLVGMHLGRFREAYTEMTGMMAGMTMGMLNGFVLGYAAAAAANSMFWGNLFGILLGLSLGLYFGRPGGLMGIMDGAMGGAMGGSMGAMLAVMVAFPHDAQFWTAILLGLLYIAGMCGLVVLIEQSAPGHAALHRLAPMFTKAMAREVAEEADRTNRGGRGSRGTMQGSERRMVDYYALLGVPTDAHDEEISEAYLEAIERADDVSAPRIERALAVLTDPQKRQSYDLKLAESQLATDQEDYYPPPRQKQARSHIVAASTTTTSKSTANATIPVVSPGSNGKGRSGPTSPTSPTSPVPARASSGGTTPAKSGANTKRGKQHGTKASKGNTGGQQQGAKIAQRQQVRYASKRIPVQQNRVISIPVVGGLAFVVLVVALTWLGISMGAARNGGTTSEAVPWTTPNAVVGAAGETQAQLEQQAVTAKMGADGKQTADVVLNSATFQYEPKVIKVKQGITVRFNLSTINGDPG